MKVTNKVKLSRVDHSKLGPLMMLELHHSDEDSSFQAFSDEYRSEYQFTPKTARKLAKALELMATELETKKAKGTKHEQSQAW